MKEKYKLEKVTLTPIIQALITLKISNVIQQNYTVHR